MMYRSILPRFVVWHITHQVTVICQAIGEYQGFALQSLGNAHLAKPHGAEDQPVGTVRQHQVDVLVGGRVAQQVKDEHIPAGLLRGLFDGQQQLDGERCGRGVQREYTDGSRLEVVAAHLARRQARYELQFINGAPHPLKGFGAQFFRIIERSRNRHQGHAGQLCNVFH
ncbi:hypothetical protein D9M71_696730 [compost metagenome]